MGTKEIIMGTKFKDMLQHFLRDILAYILIGVVLFLLINTAHKTISFQQKVVTIHEQQILMLEEILKKLNTK